MLRSAILPCSWLLVLGCGGPVSEPTTPSPRTSPAAVQPASGASSASPSGASSAPPSASPSAAPAPAADPDAVVVRWAVSQGLWGSELFEIRGSGHAQYDFQPVPPGQPAVRGARTLTAAELDSLHRTLLDNDFCHIPPSARLGIPDEGRPTLTLGFPDLQCSLTLWDGEWRDLPRPHACERAVAALRDLTRHESP